MVINITSITNSNPARLAGILTAQCDRALSKSSITPTVFVNLGSAAGVQVDRSNLWPEKRTDGCAGESVVAFTSATLQDYCQVARSLDECKAVPKTTSSATTGVRSRLLASAFMVVGSLVVALTR